MGNQIDWLVRSKKFALLLGHN